MARISWQRPSARSLPPLTPARWQVVWRSLNRWQGLGGGLIGSSLLIALWLWSWQVVVSAAVSLLSMVLIYQSQQSQWQQLWQNARQLWQRLWSRSNRQLSLTIAGGGIVGVSTYLATAVWAEFDSAALAIGALLQGGGTLAIFLLLIGRAGDRSLDQPTPETPVLDRLTDADPLKRLIAIRQATRWASQSALAEQGLTKADLADCFRLMLNRETEPTLRAALTEGLQRLSPVRLEASIAPPLSMPLPLKQEAPAEESLQDA